VKPRQVVPMADTPDSPEKSSRRKSSADWGGLPKRATAKIKKSIDIFILFPLNRDRITQKILFNHIIKICGLQRK
jgi:hypothetical protein